MEWAGWEACTTCQDTSYFPARSSVCSPPNLIIHNRTTTLPLVWIRTLCLMVGCLKWGKTVREPLMADQNMQGVITVLLGNSMVYYHSCRAVVVAVVHWIPLRLM